MLKDPFLRHHDYLRVSVTDKCNLRCRYCMPPDGVEWLPHDMVLRNEEFVHLIGVFVSMGVRKVRFTGGEPLIRRGIIDIIGQVRELFPDIELCLTTNGTHLQRYLDDLARLEVRQLNISIDTLDRDRYEFITRRKGLEHILSAIDRALDKKYFSIKINAVLLEETLEELESFFNYCSDRDLVLRFIERMPFTEDDCGVTVSSDTLIERIGLLGELQRRETSDTRVARMYELKYGNSHTVKLGVIPAMSHHFCSKCNRLRLTSNGQLKTCLFATENFDLMTPLRNGAGDDDLKEIIRQGIAKKAKSGSHIVECMGSDGGCHALVNGVMSRIGG